ncbi:hypothetical protein SLS60_011064 [Paraconiothyrium brasiliense]|uniref:CENP-V/GFA domain-containing protein n=1 Tax=Paraconiothyrium brasiliense TaxID=300254 RepID=A0ABR3QKQ1_9PLEO
MSHPTQITGGCLCGSVRYTISFNDPQWPPATSNCQCTQCRKWTTTLVSHALLLELSQVHSLTDSPTYTEFQSSDIAARSFCSKCGGGLAWKSEKMMPGKIILFTGTIDEEWIMGKRKEGKETETGKEVEWEGGYGEVLCKPQVSLFWEKAIKGITDFDMGQKKCLQEE